MAPPPQPLRAHTTPGYTGRRHPAQPSVGLSPELQVTLSWARRGVNILGASLAQGDGLGGCPVLRGTPGLSLGYSVSSVKMSQAPQQGSFMHLSHHPPLPVPPSRLPPFNFLRPAAQNYLHPNPCLQEPPLWPSGHFLIEPHRCAPDPCAQTTQRQTSHTPQLPSSVTDRDTATGLSGLIR